jgi:response regulator RpfG family c-di-GMP phosphodiesterase
MPEKYILMLENDSDDRYITQSTLNDLSIAVPIRYEYYSPSLRKSLAEPPALILLGYNTSPESGLHIVKEFKNDPVYKRIPLVLLIENLPREAIDRYYDAGVNTIIKKPSKDHEIKEKIQTFFRYWFNVAEL